MHFAPRFKWAVGSILFVAWLAAAAAGQQIPQVDDSTSPPTHTPGHWTIEAPHESVNPANGQVSLRFDVALPQGRVLSPTFSFDYDSAGAQNVTWLGDSRVGLAVQSTELASDGWSYAIPQLTYGTFKAMQPSGPNMCTVTTGYIFQGADGTRKTLRLAIAGYDGYPNVPGDYCEGGDGFPPQTSDSDGDGWLATTLTEGDGNQDYLPHPVTVTAPDGTAYLFSASAGSTFGQAANSITDANGNQLSVSVNQSGAITYTDELGRTALSTSGFAQSSDTITTDGFGSYTATWASEPGGATVTLENGSCPETSAASLGGGTAITSLTTPEGTYSFTYDPTYGLLDQITYPNGGYVQYTWGLPGADNEAVQLGFATKDQPPIINPCETQYQHPVVTERKVYNGGTLVEDQTFQYSTTWQGGGSWSAKATIVTTTDEVANPAQTWTKTYTYAPGPALVSIYIPTYSVLIPQMPLEQSIVTQQGGKTLLEVDEDWTSGYPSLLADQYTTLDNGEKKWTHYAYDANGQVSERDDYDYGAGAPGGLLRAIGVTYAAGFSGNITDRPSAIVTCASDTPCQSASASRKAETDYAYNSANGNLLTSARWLSGANCSTQGADCLTTTFGYDSYGNRTAITDPAGHTTSVCYDASCTGGNATGQDAYPTVVTDALGHTNVYQWAADGALSQRTGPNGNYTDYTYGDSWGRLTEIESFAAATDPDCPNHLCAETTFAYTPSTLETKRLIDTSGDWADQLETFDGLGRDSADATETSANTWSRVETCYNGMGEKSTVTYPFYGAETGAATCPTPTQPYDSFQYDALGRETLETHSPDGTTFITSYNGRATETQDEGNGAARVTRIAQDDGLGHLASVCEVTSQTDAAGNAPAGCGLDAAGTGFLTSYTYDPLGNLTGVVQGAETRSFQYDGLSRLIQATNPETGTVYYIYDASPGNPNVTPYPGELVQEWNARGYASTFQYDALHRPTMIFYDQINPGGTPAEVFEYDQTSALGRPVANGIGRMTSAYTVLNNTAQTGEIFSHDAMGRVVDNAQCFSDSCPENATFNVVYAWDLAGDMTMWAQAPETEYGGYGYSYGYSYDLGQRVTGVTAQVPGRNVPQALLQNAAYNADGEELSAQLNLPDGAAPLLNEVQTYDARGRLLTKQVTNSADTTVYSLSQAYQSDSDTATANDSVNGNWSYGYDALNRLAATAGQQNLAFVYDRYGNRWQQNYADGSQAGAQLTFAGGKNRPDGWSFDASGNLLSDGLHSYQYDVAGRIVSVDSGGTASYVYDAQGRRVQRIKGGGVWSDLLSLDGQVGTEVLPTSQGGWQRSEAYAGSRHLATYDPNVNTAYFSHGDALGTEHARSDIDGNSSQTCTSWPWGDNQTCTGTDPTSNYFTGKPNDSESNLDYFGARYYSPTLGRFLTPDWSATPEAIPYANLENPQSLNLYSYVLNNPVTGTDADGHCPACTEAILAWAQFAAFHPAAAARIEQGAEGVGELVGGTAGVIAAAAGGLATSETGAGIAAGAVGVAAGLGTADAGLARIVLAAKGPVSGQDQQALSDAAAVANPVGAVTAVGAKLAGASDNAALGAASDAAAATDVALATAGAGELASGDPAHTAGEAATALQAAAEVSVAARKASCAENGTCKGQLQPKEGAPGSGGGGGL